jgi:hypothetical protein
MSKYDIESAKGLLILSPQPRRVFPFYSANRGDALDRAIEEENKATNDFMILDHVEGYDELPIKTQIYFRTAIQTWDADFYFKVDDDVFVSLGKRQVEHVWRCVLPSAGLRIAAFHFRRGCRAAWTDHFGLMTCQERIVLEYQGNH